MMRGPGGAVKVAEEKKDPKVAELLPSLKVLSEELKKEIEAGRIQISMEQRGLVVSFKQAALFPSGEDVIAADGVEGLKKVAEAIEKLPNPVRLEGHTDAIPIKTARFRSNWELSAGRSIAVMEMLASCGVPSGRMSIAGYADTAPVASNDTEEGRARNRRVDLVILNEKGMVAEPAKPGILPRSDSLNWTTCPSKLESTGSAGSAGMCCAPRCTIPKSILSPRTI